MSFFQVIRIMVLIIILMFVWTIGSYFILPSIEVFLPSLPPYPIWKSIYKVLCILANAVFMFILVFVLIMYVIYWVIKTFVPDFPIPFKTILLALTPLYELRVSGVFGLIEAIIEVIFSTLPIPDRFKNLGYALGRFFSGSFIALMNEFGGGRRQQKSTPTPPPEPEPGEANFQDTDADEPTDDPNLSPAENKYVEKEYQQCIAENFSPPSSEGGAMSSVSTAAANSAARTICKLRKTQTLSNLISAKLLG